MKTDQRFIVAAIALRRMQSNHNLFCIHQKKKNLFPKNFSPNPRLFHRLVVVTLILRFFFLCCMSNITILLPSKLKQTILPFDFPIVPALFFSEPEPKLAPSQSRRHESESAPAAVTVTEPRWRQGPAGRAAASAASGPGELAAQAQTAPARRSCPSHTMPSESA